MSVIIRGVTYRSATHAANELGVSVSRVCQARKAGHLDRVGAPQRNAWTKAQEDILRANYRQRSDEELAEMVGRSKEAVRARRVLLGLRRPGTYARSWEAPE